MCSAMQPFEKFQAIVFIKIICAALLLLIQGSAIAASTAQLIPSRQHSGTLTDIDVSTSGRLAVTGGGDLIELWEFKSGRLVREMKAGTDVFAVAITPDESHVWAGDKNGLKIWEASSGTLAASFSVGLVKSITFSNDHK